MIAVRMDILWQKITKTIFRLDDIWKVVEETPGQWRAYRGNGATLTSGSLAEAMREAERLRSADMDYRRVA